MKKVFLLKIVYFYSCLFFIVLGRYLSYLSYFSYFSYHSYFSYFAFSELLIINSKKCWEQVATLLLLCYIS